MKDRTKSILIAISEYFNPQNDINTSVFAKEVYKYAELMLQYYILVLDEMRDAIIEDVNEPAYKIDRCLAQLCGISDLYETFSNFINLILLNFIFFKYILVHVFLL